MASINIGQSNAGDEFYRYKMPALQSKVRGGPVAQVRVFAYGSAQPARLCLPPRGLRSADAVLLPCSACCATR